MSMNQIIAQRRRALGMTQEQLADRLGVTAPAVNKWEKGSTCPDVGLLPPLARLLEIDMNELFCFYKSLSEQEILDRIKEVNDTSTRLGLEAAFEQAEKMIREFPNCESLCFQLAITLDGLLVLSGEEQHSHLSLQQQILEWYERMSTASNPDIRNRALFMLAGRYLQAENNSEAQRMLDQLPEPSPMDKRLLQAELYIRRGEFSEAGALMARAVLTGINDVQNHLMKLMEIEAKTGNALRAQQLAEISQKASLLFEQWNYNAAIAPLMMAVERKDAQSALPLLDQLLGAIDKPWLPGETTLYHYIPSSGQAPDLRRMLNPLLKNLENSPDCDFLRENPDFHELLSKYRTKLEAYNNQVTN